MKGKHDKLLRALRKKTDSCSFETSQYGIVTDWIDTGDYGLNRIISGDIHKGIPSGRITLLGGESMTGKSFVALGIAAQALKDGYDMIFYFDSEGGAMGEFFENRGCDLSKIEQILVGSVEDAVTKILGTFTMIQEYQKENSDFKAMFILDSLGALVPNKFINDASNGKVVSEMGGRAKLINNLIKSCTIPALRTNIPLIVVNHVYDDPAAMYASKVKKQGGGKGAQYMARLTIQCTKSMQKNENQENGYYKATVLKFMAVKNSFVKPFIETEMLLNFTEGPNPYFGLFRPAMRMGFITSPTKGFYCIPSWNDKKIRLKDLMEGDQRDEIWNSFLEEFNEKSKEEMSYDGGAGKELDLDEIEEEAIKEVEE
jgi:RecA/RadA recombinase